MPYEVKHFGNGWKVCDEKKCFSKKAMCKKCAEKQRVAIALSESRKTGKPTSLYFK